MNTIAENRVWWVARGVHFTTDTVEVGRAILGAYQLHCDVVSSPDMEHGAMLLFRRNALGHASRLIAVQSNAWHRLLALGIFELQESDWGHEVVPSVCDEKSCNAVLDALESRRGKGGPARRKLAGQPPKPNPKS